MKEDRFIPGHGLVIVKEEGSSILHPSSIESLDGAVEIVDQDFNFCGCGYPAEFCRYIRDVLRRAGEENQVDDKGRETRRAFYRDTETLWANEGQGLAVLYMLDEKKFIEHGSGIFGSWLTEKGKEMLKRLEDLGLGK